MFEFVEIEMFSSPSYVQTGTEMGFTPGGEPPLVPVPRPGASIRD